MRIKAISSTMLLADIIIITNIKKSLVNKYDSLLLSETSIQYYALKSFNTSIQPKGKN